MKIKDIRAFVEEKTQLDLSKKIRKREYVYARSIFFYLAKKYARCRYSQIAKEVKCHHATVLHSLNNTIPIIFNEEPQLKSICDNFLNLFKEEIIADSKTILYSFPSGTG